MKRMKKPIAVVLILALTALMGQSALASSITASTPVTAPLAVASANIKDADKNTSWTDSATKITLSQSGAAVSGTGASVSGKVVTITQKGDYVISGTISDGQIVVAAQSSEKVHIILNGANITNKTGTAIYASQCDKLVITLAENTLNSLTDGGENFVYADSQNEEPNAALFSKDDLTINGTGSLTVNAGFNNGIGTKDDLLIMSGNITVTAPNHGIRGNDSVTVVTGNLNITAGKDGIQTSNSEDADKGFILIEGGIFNITSANDGVQAETSLTVKAGTFNIVSGGGSEAAIVKQSDTMAGMRQNMGVFDAAQPNIPQGGKDIPTGEKIQPSQEKPGEISAAQQISESDPAESYKGMKAVTAIIITGGIFKINSADDSIHSNDSISIQGGSFELASGDDAVHADGDLTVTGAPTINISTSYEGLESNTMTIEGGTINLAASDDGINISGGKDTIGMDRFGPDSFKESTSRWLKITGGNITIIAEHDGIDINGSGEMTGGVLNITAATSGEGDTIDSDGTFLRTGGTITEIGGGKSGGAPTGTNQMNSKGAQGIRRGQ